MKSYVSFFITTLIACAAFAADKPFTNFDALKSALGFTKYYSQSAPHAPIKIAILDKGFFGFEKEIGKTLPANTRYNAGPLTAPADLKVDHGLKMAQILTSLMTNDLQATQWTPSITLYNVFGYTNFKAAIDDIIANQVDIVLYSEVWEYGGNNDGQGFLNAEVTRATKAGVTWINAAGNFALTTYNTSIRTSSDDWVQLPDQNNSLAIRCENSKA